MAAPLAFEPRPVAICASLSPTSTFEFESEALKAAYVRAVSTGSLSSLPRGVVLCVALVDRVFDFDIARRHNEHVWAQGPVCYHIQDVAPLQVRAFVNGRLFGRIGPGPRLQTGPHCFVYMFFRRSLYARGTLMDYGQAPIACPGNVCLLNLPEAVHSAVLSDPAVRQKLIEWESLGHIACPPDDGPRRIRGLRYAIVGCGPRCQVAGADDLVD